LKNKEWWVNRNLLVAYYFFHITIIDHLNWNKKRTSIVELL
jgi:hypothetical protein